MRCLGSVPALRRVRMARETKPGALSDGYRRTCTLQRLTYPPSVAAGLRCFVVMEESRHSASALVRQWHADGHTSLVLVACDVMDSYSRQVAARHSQTATSSVFTCVYRLHCYRLYYKIIPLPAVTVAAPFIKTRKRLALDFRPTEHQAASSITALGRLSPLARPRDPSHITPSSTTAPPAHLNPPPTLPSPSSSRPYHRSLSALPLPVPDSSTTALPATRPPTLLHHPAATGYMRPLHQRPR